jgi:hypothetical protein
MENLVLTLGVSMATEQANRENAPSKEFSTPSTITKQPFIGIKKGLDKQALL